MSNSFNFNFGLFAGSNQSAYKRVSDDKNTAEQMQQLKTQIYNKPEILASPRSQKFNNKSWLG